MLMRIACAAVLTIIPISKVSAQSAAAKYFARHVVMPKTGSPQDTADARKYASCGGYGVGFRVNGTMSGMHLSAVVGNVADKGAALSIARTSSAAALCEDTSPPAGYPQVLACEVASNGDVSAYYGTSTASVLDTTKNAKTTTYVAGLCEPT